jgi:predicted transcriptional regulator
MPIGNKANLKTVAYDLLNLANEAKQVGRNYLKIQQSIDLLEAQGLTMTEQQVTDALSQIDVAEVQTRFDTAKANYLNSDIIPTEE